MSAPHHCHLMSHRIDIDRNQLINRFNIICSYFSLHAPWFTSHSSYQFAHSLSPSLPLALSHTHTHIMCDIYNREQTRIGFINKILSILWKYFRMYSNDPAANRVDTARDNTKSNEMNMCQIFFTFCQRMAKPTQTGRKCK